MIRIKIILNSDKNFKMVKMDLIDGARHDILHEYESGAAHKVIQLIRRFLEIY